MKFIDYHLENPIPNDLYEEFYSLLELSFPKNERRSKDGQKNLLKVPNYHILAIFEDKFIGFIVFWEFDNFVFYEHFATCPDRRNCGIGRKTLDHLSAIHSKPCFLEIELPTDEITTRRQKFYEKNRFTTHTFQYDQPPYNSDDDATQLLIMSKNVEIDEKSFWQFKKTIYNDVYNIKTN